MDGEVERGPRWCVDGEEGGGPRLVRMERRTTSSRGSNARTTAMPFNRRVKSVPVKANVSIRRECQKERRPLATL